MKNIIRYHLVQNGTIITYPIGSIILGTSVLSGQIIVSISEPFTDDPNYIFPMQNSEIKIQQVGVPTESNSSFKFLGIVHRSPIIAEYIFVTTN